MKKYLLPAILFLCSCSVFAGNRIETNMMKKVDQRKMNQWVDSVFNSLNRDQRIGQLITAITTGENTEANKKKILGWVKNQHIGGIIFLKGTPLEQAELTNVSQKNAKTPLLISIDGEWGLSMRLSGTTRFPKNMMLGAIRGDSLMYDYGCEVARQCKEMGIHINYAPDVDANSNPDNPVIGLRSYGEDPKRVARLAMQYARGLEDGGVMSVAKHFPGHGDTSADSHHTLPLINHSKKRLEEVELIPFESYINAGFGGVMIGHLNIPALDKSGAPSSLSKAIVTDLLQEKMGFTGLVFTDGLAMKGVAEEPNMAIRILKAGNDVLLGPISVPKEFEAIKAALARGDLSEDLINEKCRKVLRYKYILGVNNTVAIEKSDLLDRLNTPMADWLNRKLNERAMTLLRNEKQIVPLKGLNNKKIAVVSLGDSKGNAFHRMLNQYADVTTFGVQSDKELSALKSRLAGFNTIIVAVHNRKSFSNNVLQSICADKQSVFTFFTTPYTMRNYMPLVKEADAVLVAYEDTPYSNEYAAQALFGGIMVDGVLPVSVKGLYSEGDGLVVNKTRLGYSSPEEVGMLTNKMKAIESIVKEGISAEAFPGCQVLVAKNGVVVYNEAFGTFAYNNKKEVSVTDIYDIASMTKATATLPAVMKLYDEKKISLLDKLSKHVPVLRETDKAAITIKEALFHETGITSFIPYYMPAIDTDSYEGKLFGAKKTEVYNALFDAGTWARTDYKYRPNLISTTPRKGFELQVADGLYANVAYKDVILNEIAGSKLRASKKYLYSCLNFMLLKEVVEQVSKKGLDVFVQQNFFRPLGATTTTYNPLKKFGKDRIIPTEKDDFLRKQLLQGYVHDEGAAFMGGVSGNAGLFSNANDLAKLYQMFLNEGVYGGERYLSRATCATFTKTKSANSRRGLGFDKPEPRNEKTSPCSPQTPLSTYGHTGFTGTCFWIDPDNELIYIFLSNRVNDKRTHKALMSLNIRPRIQEVIYNAMKK
ncbi:beta-N-acetylhexosaminidase [Dysgonomonas sp. PH5-45]|uniref:glycoside hydrolase family 3 N-terminal domain-containing protein n=1 Tax=unclassified Dysgonomonas TaxID=2630389 RepID=UPI00247388BA|nr:MULTISPECIES: glycoside hydrolase family 3 N-terminal domain-containing protein [unclassified Dysgonomonas]MDH6355757.1 beta-N-acetylhexosaminidase [Dysgonomonas sp. PH5-45]MDH6388654.1 beta-N-acetylhexosaminidase [Dysgonomonas sp. PH5-37]